MKVKDTFFVPLYVSSITDIYVHFIEFYVSETLIFYFMYIRSLFPGSTSLKILDHTKINRKSSMLR